MKRTFFKKLTLTFSVLLIFCAFAIGALAASPSDFVDFPTGWSNEAVTAAVNNGLLNGRSANRIEPEGNLTRAEMATIINRAFGATIEKNISSFGDVSPNEWYYHEIAKAYNMQTFQGDASGTMRPDSYITREEVFAVIARALVLETTDYSPLNRFADTYAVSEWAKPYAAILVAKGYVNGDNLGNLNPLANITREEFAQIMHNIVKTYHITAGEHKYAGPASTLIRTGGVTLSDVTVEGDLILGDGVGKGNVNLINVTIKGRLLARGGEGKVTLTNTTVAGGVVVKDVNGVVNFNNYRKEEPFKGIREITKATFIGETGTTPTPGGSTGGGGGGGGGGGSSTPSANTYRYIVNYYLENIDGTYTIHSSSINKTVSKNTVVTPYKDFENYTFVVGSPSSEKVTSIKVTKNLNYNYYYNLKTYSVSISLPGGGTWSETFKHGETLGSKFAFASYPGVKFINNANGSEVTASTTVTSAMTIISKSPYTVTFNHNDGMGGVTEKTVYSGDTIGSNLPTVTKTGYTFDKWTVNSDGSGDEINASTVISGPVTAYAQWTPTQYTITYYPGRFGFDPLASIQTTYNIETGATLPEETDFASHTGFIFDGWYMEADFKTKVSSIPVGSYGNVTLYANWLDETKTYYNFTFDYQYDSKTETRKIESGLSVNKPTDPVRTGYTFGGWFTDSACTSAYVFSTPVTADKTIYAKWTADEYDIVYELNGGSFKQGASYPAKYTVDILPLNLPASDALEYEGKEFKGWYKDAGFTHPVSQIPANTTGEFKVYAKWETKTYQVTIITPGAPNETKNFNHGQTIGEVITQEPTRNGYTFIGYNTALNGSGTPYTSTSAITSDIGTLYTQWSIITYHVTHDLNGGVALPGVNTVIDFNITESVNLLTHDVHFSKHGYVFEGWYKTPDFSDSAITSIPVGTFENITVYAKWTPKPYAIRYELNGATKGNTQAFIDEYNTETPVTLPIAGDFGPYPGYTFGGWYNNSGFTGTPITEVGRGETGDKVFYAKWDKVSYGITYELNGGEKLNAEAFKASYTVTDTIYLPTALDFKPKAGYTFGGWYEEADFSGSPVVSIQAGSIGAKTFWVKWDAKTYKVIYDGNTNTSGTMDFTNHKYGEVTYLRDNTFSKTGHKFLGWSKVQGASVADYNDKSDVTLIIAELEAQNKSEIILYAVWEAETYTLTFNVNGGNALTAADLPAGLGYTIENGKVKVAVKYNSTYPQLPTPTHSEISKKFVGWAINGVQINPGETANITSNSDVVAIWTDKAVHAVTIYDFSEGSSKTVNVIDGEKIGNLTGMKKTGYTFDKFYKHNTTEAFDIVNTVITGPVEIDAGWIANIYTIKYNGSGNTSGTMDNTTHTYGQISTLRQNDFAKTGHTFLGWTKTQGSQTVNYNDKADAGAILAELAASDTREITLYAVWSANSYSVKYDKNDASAEGTMTNSAHIYGIASSLSPNAFTKTGYSFVGWNTAADGSGTSYANAAQVTELSAQDGSEVVLYAQWKANTYYIEYVANGGSGSMTNSTLTYDAFANLGKNVFVRTGYTFAGWSMDQNSQTAQFADEASVSNLTAEYGKTVKLYAVWSPVSYKIIYKGKSDSDSFIVTGSMTDSTFTYDAQSQFGENAFVRSGYKFVGWVYKNVTYTPNTVYTALNFSSLQDEEITVYAKWERISYTVKYHPGVNTTEVKIEGTTADSNHYYDEEKALTTNDFKRKGYTFKGWTTVRPGGIDNLANTFSLNTQEEDEVVFSDGEGVENLTEEEDGVVILYAVWEANRYKIEYFNDHKFFGGWPGSHWAVYDEQVDIASTSTIASEGYDFVEWNTEPDGTGAGYEQGKPAINLTSEPDATVVLYPISNERIYFIKLNYRDDTNAVIDEGQYKYTDIYTFPGSRGYKRTGYTFAGWVNWSDNLSKPTYLEGQTLTKPWIGNGATKIFHGAWTPNKYKVSFNVDGGKPLTDAEIPSDASYSFENGKWVMTVTYDSVYPVLPKAEWINGSKYFAYWINEADNSKIVAGQMVKITEETVLRAVWTDEIVHSVVFTDYNLDGTAHVTEVINGFAIAKPNDPPARVGYTFGGWFEDIYHSNPFDFVSVTAEGSAKTYTAYPNWIAHKYEIVFDGNGATGGSMNNQGFKYDSKQELKENAYVKAGYIFDGWTTNSDGTGTRYENKAEILNLTAENGAKITLYANWKESLYTVIFNGNGGTGVVETLTFSYNDNVVLSGNAYVNKGYTFLGWSENKNASIPTYIDKASKEDFINALLLSEEGTITLYAVWKENTYTLAFNSNNAEGTMTSVTLGYDDSHTLAANTFTKNGYNFTGWNTAADGSGTKFNDGEVVTGLSVNDGATVTLYAQWEIIEYAISYYGAQFVNPSAVPYTYTVEDEVILPTSGNIFPMPTGDFLYWEDENGMPVDKILKGTTGNKIFTAKRGTQAATLFTVSFVSDGEKFNELKIFDGETLNSNANYKEPIKAKHNFLGWNTRADGSGTNYIPGETPVTASVTLYAVWEEIPLENFTITYNNVDTADMKNPSAFVSSYTEEDEITLPEASDFNERANGEVFAGWYDNAAFDGEPVTSISKGSTGNKEYWAKWAQNYIVRFYRGAVTVSENHRKYIGDAKVPSGTSMIQSDIDNMISKVTKESTVEYYDGSYSHTVEGELWYVDSGEWKLFNSDVVIDRDIDVFYANKFVSLCLNVELGGFTLDIPGYISVPYNSETRIVESAKDLMAAARGKLSLALSTDDIYAKAIEKAAEKAAEKTSEKGIVLMDTEGNLKFVEIDTPISNIIKAKEVDGEIAKYIEKIIVENSEDGKIESATKMAHDSALIQGTVLGGMTYDYALVKSYISGLNEAQRIDFADKLHDALYAEQYYHDFIDAFEAGHDHFVVTNENLDFVMAVATAVNEYTYEELKDRIYARFGKVIDILGDDVAKEFMQDAQKRYYKNANILWDDMKANEADSGYKSEYPSYLTFKVNVVDHLFKPMFDKYRVKVIDKLIEKDFYHYTENTYLRELVEMDADTIVNDLLYKVPETEDNIGYALWPSENGESGLMHYYDYFFHKLLVADNARLWYKNNLTESELESMRMDIYEKAAKAFNKANEMLDAYEKDGSLPMGKNISDLKEIEAFAKIFNKVEDKIVKALEKFKTTQFYGKEWTADSVRYDIPYSDLAGNVILGTDDPVFNVDSLLDDKYVGKALDKAGFKEFEDDFDSSIGSTVTVQSIERIFRNNRIEIRRYYE